MTAYKSLTARQLRRELASLSAKREAARGKGDRWAASNYHVLMDMVQDELANRRCRKPIFA